MSLPVHRMQTMRGLSPGTRLGRYVVVRRLGSGGMAEVYLGRQDGPRRFAKPVALKLMHAHLLDDRGFVEMFLREARIAATLDHPGIVAVLDVGEGKGEHFLALEYVHGHDLRELLVQARHDPLPLGCAIRIVMDVCAALHYAHERVDSDGRPLGIVHRDVSPSNILVSNAGAVKLADFGVARIESTQATASGSLKGKLGYMSPEQCLQEAIDRRSDVFALGVVLYEATTGRRAFPGEPLAVMNAVIDGRVVPPEQAKPGYPPALAEIVRRAMATDVAARFPTAAELGRALTAFAQAHGLDIRNEVLAAELERRYGDARPPSLELEREASESTTLGDPTDDAVTIASPRSPAAQRRGAMIAGALAGMLAVGGLAGWAIARGATSSVPPASTMEPAPPQPTAPVRAAVTPVVVAPVASTPSAPATTTAVAAPERVEVDGPTPKRRRAAPRKRRPAVDPGDAMLPVSAP